ncbi:MAG: DUF4123 domain-containing protein [Rhodobacteraceae bacterium]|nr:MAG: DUF4123 domain-containing protein [Paracoccaceae bacterium]
MSRFETWVGNCHLRAREGGGEYCCLTAVWAHDYNSFRATLAAHVGRTSYTILWLEEVLPSPQYLARHGAQHRQIGNIAQAVHPGHTVELGPMQSMVADGVATEPESWMAIEEIEGIEPLDAQIGAHPPKTAPDALQAPLFGQPEPTEAEIAHYGRAEDVPPMRTYAVLDAAKMPYLLTSQLDSSELHHQSLFHGETQEELREHAPCLVELEDGNDFTRKLFTTDKAMGLWEKELGIFIRSRADFAAIRKHFRKFIVLDRPRGSCILDPAWLKERLHQRPEPPLHALRVIQRQRYHACPPLFFPRSTKNNTAASPRNIAIKGSMTRTPMKSPRNRKFKAIRMNGRESAPTNITVFGMATPCLAPQPVQIVASGGISVMQWGHWGIGTLQLVECMLKQVELKASKHNSIVHEDDAQEPPARHRSAQHAQAARRAWLVAGVSGE